MSDPRPILIVDDDDDIRETLAEILDDSGYTTVLATNGRDALDRLLAGLTPSIILLDLMMPIMDGYQFIEAKRSFPLLADIPLAVITAGASVDRARLPGATVIPKPINLGQLLATVSKANAG